MPENNPARFSLWPVGLVFGFVLVVYLTFKFCPYLWPVNPRSSLYLSETLNQQLYGQNKLMEPESEIFAEQYWSTIQAVSCGTSEKNTVVDTQQPTTTPCTVKFFPYLGMAEARVSVLHVLNAEFPGNFRFKQQKQDHDDLGVDVETDLDTEVLSADLAYIRMMATINAAAFLATAGQERVIASKLAVIRNKAALDRTYTVQNYSN